MLRTIVPCVVLLNGTRYFFPTVYADQVTCSLILQYFLGQSGTKKESGQSRTSQADSALAAAGASIQLRTYAEIIYAK